MRHLWEGLVLSVLLAGPASAIVIGVDHREVSKSNAAEFGIAVDTITDKVACPGGIEFWIRAPSDATSGLVAVSDNTGAALFRGALEVIELPPEPVLAPDYQFPDDVPEVARNVIREMQQQRGFLARGFRGACFCVAASAVSQTTFSFQVHVGQLLTDTYDLGQLRNWLP